MGSEQRKRGQHHLARLEGRGAYLALRNGSDDPNDPQSKLSAEEIHSEVQRLLAVCLQQGVGAVVPHLGGSRELLEALALECKKEGLPLAAEYLLSLP